MAKRGRPSNKVLKRRKEIKRKCQKIVFVTVLIMIGYAVVAYFLFFK